MGFKKGKEKTGGRKAGVPNKKTEHFFEMCDKYGFDPVEFNINVAMNNWKALGYPNRTYQVSTGDGVIEVDFIELKDRVNANNKLLDFMYPKRKAIEVTNDTGEQKGFILAYNPNDLKKIGDDK